MYVVLCWSSDFGEIKCGGRKRLHEEPPFKALNCLVIKILARMNSTTGT